MAALRWARMPRPALGGPASGVLRDLADRASESGVCWPAVATIASETGYSVSTVRRALRRLEQAGLITVKMTGRSSRYTLHVTALSGQSDRSERSERPVRAVTLTAKASRTRREPRPAAAAYAPPPPDVLSVTAVDDAMLLLARGWIQAQRE